MAKWHVGMLVLISAALLVVAASPAAAVDNVVLRDGGGWLSGDVDDADLVLTTPQGEYKVTRARAWRVTLGYGTTGDSVDLRNGNRISGLMLRDRYTIRLPGGETRMLWRGQIATIGLGAPRSAATPRLTDVVMLANGDNVYGEVAPAEFDVVLASGTQRVRRDAIWMITLDSANGDEVALTNGSMLAGVVDQPRYEVRTPDGQVVAFARSEVKAIGIAQPPRPRAAIVAPPVATVTPPAGPAPTVVAPPAALPPAVRAVLRDLQFEFDRWDLTPEARRSLDELATAMKAHPQLRLLIEGHADERGTSEYNLALGARRAQSARDYLVSGGIEADRVETISYGEERPLDPAHNEMAWALNRRAHFVVKAP